LSWHRQRTFRAVHTWPPPVRRTRLRCDCLATVAGRSVRPSRRTQPTLRPHQCVITTAMALAAPEASDSLRCASPGKVQGTGKGAARLAIVYLAIFPVPTLADPRPANIPGRLAVGRISTPRQTHLGPGGSMELAAHALGKC
jgi:hypothetical protein